VVNFSLARREVNMPLRLCAKQSCHFVDASATSVRKRLIVNEFRVRLGVPIPDTHERHAAP